MATAIAIATITQINQSIHQSINQSNLPDGACSNSTATVAATP